MGVDAVNCVTFQAARAVPYSHYSMHIYDFCGSFLFCRRFCLIPLLISVHSTSSRSTAWKIGAGLLLALAADFPASWKMFPIYGISAFLPTFFYVGTISTISLGARFRKLSLARQDDVFAAEHHARLSENKRLQAERSTVLPLVFTIAWGIV